jgi:tRNA threonylcarbamoyl adenosine modification protein (Sua5/YciO/YrdC/YwlC family)
MTRYFTMHPINPQPRLVKEAVASLQAGQLLVYPTDSTYAIGCALSSKNALNALRTLRGISEKHPLTLLCNSISQAAEYCLIDNAAFRLLKEYTPGAYTFILPATKSVPKLAQGLKRKVVGVRIPNHPVPLSLIAELGVPILSTSLWLKGEDAPLSDPHDVVEHAPGQVDLVLDVGLGKCEPTTVVDLTEDKPLLIRRGVGDPTPFLP